MANKKTKISNKWKIVGIIAIILVGITLFGTVVGVTTKDTTVKQIETGDFIEITVDNDNIPNVEVSDGTVQTPGTLPIFRMPYVFGVAHESNAKVLGVANYNTQTTNCTATLLMAGNEDMLYDFMPDAGGWLGMAAVNSKTGSQGLSKVDAELSELIYTINQTQYKVVFIQGFCTANKLIAQALQKTYLTQNITTNIEYTQQMDISSLIQVFKYVDGNYEAYDCQTVITTSFQKA